MRLTPILCTLLFTSVVSFTLPNTLIAQGPADALMRLLKSGRLPPERQGTVIELICKRGTANDLAYIFEQATNADGFAPTVRPVALQHLATAAIERKLKPTGDLSSLRTFMEAANASVATRQTAVQLAGLWQVEGARDALIAMVLDEKSTSALREAAMDSLVRLGGDKTKATLTQLTGADQPQRLRYLAIAALARLDLDAAAKSAAKALALSSSTPPNAVMAAFFASKQGPDKLTAALKAQPPHADTAKLALRYMYSVGRSDAELANLLSDAAGINLNRTITPAEIDALVKQVPQQGDPARGEKVFRRADLSCMKCHMLNGVGGAIGPDLRDVGTTSPHDYLLRSILLPDESIKEVYETTRVFTFDGKSYQGIVTSEDDNRIILKDAEGKPVTISKEDIDLREKGNSLMPKGLTNFLTRSELLDLVAFLGELGKPGPYAVANQPILRRWRVLQAADPDLVREVPSRATFQSQALDVDPSRWSSLYSLVSGTLPLSEAVALAGKPIVYVQAELQVTQPGEVGIRLKTHEGIHAWINDQPLEVTPTLQFTLTKGVHRLTFRVDSTQHSSQEFQAELLPLQGSTAQALPVGGA